MVCGAAGGRVDPLQLRCCDLTQVRSDALLASVRSRLRRDHGFTRESGRAFGVNAVWSPAPSGAAMTPQADHPAGAPLACAGYGSTVMVTAAMGFAAASQAIDLILRSQR
jgi:tRNA A37 threonylcarbamoyladenosine dehydratase